MPRQPRPSVDDQLSALYADRPRAAEWSAVRQARTIRRDPSSVKASATYRTALAERLGVPLTGPDRRALEALAVCAAGGRSATAAAVAKEAGVGPGLIRRRLSVLVRLGYAASRNGDPSRSGYTLTDAGAKALRAGHPRPRKRTDR